MGVTCSRRRGPDVSTSEEVRSTASLRVFAVDHEAAGRARELVAKTTPFVPQRVAAAFAAGHFTSSDGTVTFPREPQQRCAALLLVDVSGFTKLSEAYSKLGTGGSEEFSLLISSFLARMSDIIDMFGGDIDCFAGDALLVVFDLEKSGGPHQQRVRVTLQEAVSAAVECAIAISKELNGYEASPGYPALSIHAALAAGSLFAVECGGQAIHRSEAFLVGQPLVDLGAAMPQACISELVVAPSALSVCDTSLQGEPRLGGCVCIPLPKRCEPVKRDEAISKRKFSRTQTPYRDRLNGSVLDMMLFLDMKCQERQSSHSDIESEIRSAELVAGLRSSRGQENTSPMSAQGLDVLLRFMPQLVKSRMLAEVPLDEALAEHRDISVLFITGALQIASDSMANLQRIVILQEVLGRVIDICSGEYGAATRQITVDEKGLAVIFVFGLPSYLSGNHALRCSMAALRVIGILNQTPGLRCTAGLDSGMCFCGLVGAEYKRCEYAVLGDPVNTAARLSVLAEKRGVLVLATESLKNHLRGNHKTMLSVKLQPMGSVMLKGKTEETQLFVPQVAHLGSRGRSFRVAQSTPEKLVDRSEHCDAVQAFVQQHCTRQVAGRAPRPGLLVIHGANGSGRSSLIDCFEQMVGRSSPDQTCVEVVRIVALGKVQPFNGLARILQAVLQLRDTQAHAEFMADLTAESMRQMTMEQLPPLLQKYAHEIRALDQKDPVARLLGFQTLYARVLASALRASPTVFVVDYAENLDDCSLRVLLAVALDPLIEMDCDSETGGPAGAIILTTCEVLMYRPISGAPQAPQPVPVQDLGAQLMHLKGLSGTAIDKMAEQILRCSAMTEELSSLLREQSQGLPLQVRDLCQWLLDTSSLEVDPKGVAGLRMSMQSGRQFELPSMRAIEMQQIDQLPTTLGIVVRCASVLGESFTPPILYQLLPPNMVGSSVSLEAQLVSLEDAGLIEHMGSRFVAENQWKFCHLKHQVMVYDTILHKHRRKLHRLAALAFEADPCKGRCPLYLSWSKEQIAFHRFQVVRSGAAGQARLEKTITPDDLLAACHSTLAVVVQNCNNGHLPEALDKQARLQALLDVPWGERRDVSPEWIQAELEITQNTAQTLFRLEGHSANVSLMPRVELEDRIQQVIALQAELTSQLAELQNPGVNSRSSSLWQFNWSLRKGLVGSKGMQVAWANGVAAKILLEFIPCKCLSRATSLRLRKMFEGARDVHSKLVYAGFFGLLSWEATTFGEVAAVATEAHSVYVRAGRPKISTIVFALPVMLLVSFWSAHVMCGEVSHAEAAAALNKEVPQLEYPLRRQVYGMVRSFEGCWEPQCSERIGRWRRQEDADEEAANGAPCESESELPTAEAEAACKEWLELMSRASTGALKASWVLGPLVIARTCIHDGCRIVFLSPGTQGPGSSGWNTPTALGDCHLAGLCDLLSRCLQHWELERMNKLGTCCFPAALVWGRAMLHLFQWRLSVAGRLQIHEVQDPRLNVLVRGWDRGPELKPGIRAVVSRVLCAQAIALEDSETLEIPSAALPATIVLARLLHGCGSADIQAFHVPVEPPPTVQATNRGTVASLQHLPVKHLIPGTPDALAVALRHLEQVVGRFKIEGRRLDLNSVLAQGPGQLANSEALWEAVELYRAIKRDLAELSSG